MSKVEITYHGRPHSGYERTIRSIISQLSHLELPFGLVSAESYVLNCIKEIPRKNIAVASTNYTTKWVNRYERDEKLEVWNEAYNRKIATLIIVP